MRGADLRAEVGSVVTIDELAAKVDVLTTLVRRLQGPKLVCVAEAAATLGVSEVTVRRHVKTGKLPSKQVGRAVRVDLSRLG